MTTASRRPARKAIGIVRVSQVNGREGDSFASPDEQRERIERPASATTLRLIDTIDELDVSGGTPLDRRRRPAPRRRDCRERRGRRGRRGLLRSACAQSCASRTSSSPGSRPPAAQVLAVDVGQVTNGSCGTVAVWDDARRRERVPASTTAERSPRPRLRAVRRGVLPWANVPPGYLRGHDGVLLADPDTAPASTRRSHARRLARRWRKSGAFLAGHDIERSFAGVGPLLGCAPTWASPLRRARQPRRARADRQARR